MENLRTNRKFLMVCLALLLIISGFLAGFFAGRLVEMNIYKQTLEQIDDINPCHP